jgi:Secretion system C-terminal sorting domain
LTLITKPGKQYWIQVDGCNEAVCNYTLKYDPKELLQTVASGKIEGDATSCQGDVKSYTLSLPVNPNSSTWTITPPTGGIVLPPNNESTVNVTWSNAGTYKLCSKPKFNIKCPVTTIETSCIEVIVYPKILPTSLIQTTVYLSANTPKTINIKDLILLSNPSFKGKTTPASVTLNEPKTGRFLRKIKYTVENSICDKEGIIEFSLYVLNKNFPKSSLPQSEIRTEQQDENVEINSEHPTLSIYPNPSDEIFNLDFLEENTTYEWEVFDTKGQLILKNKNTPNVDLQHASDGIYFLKIHSNDWNDTVKLMKF